jgi:hypothetical protein
VSPTLKNKGVEKVETFEEWVRNEISVLKTSIAVHRQRIDALEKSIGKIESNTTWTVRLILGTIILGIIGLVMKGGGVQ